MKKLGSIFLALIMLLGITACGASNETDVEEELGARTETKSCYTHGGSCIVSCEYNDKNELLKETHNDDNGNVLGYTIYVCNEDSELVEVNIYNDTGWSYSSHNEPADEITVNICNLAEDLLFRRVDTYDSESNIYEESVYDSTGEFLGCTTVQYDSKEELVKELNNSEEDDNPNYGYTIYDYNFDNGEFSWHQYCADGSLFSEEYYY